MSGLDNLRRAEREKEKAEAKEKAELPSNDPHDSWDPTAFEKSLTKPLETRAEQIGKLKNLLSQFGQDSLEPAIMEDAPQKSMREQMTPTKEEIKAATAHLPPLNAFKQKPRSPMPEMRIEPAQSSPSERPLIPSAEEIETAAKRLREERESRIGSMARKGAALVRRMRGGGSRKLPRIKSVKGKRKGAG
jgi:hypothetical protein